MTELTFIAEAERFIANLDELRADDFGGCATANELAVLMSTSTDMSELQAALSMITSKNLWSIPVDDVLDTHALVIALVQNPHLNGCIIDSLWDLRTEFPGVMGHLARNGNLNEIQAMRLAVVGDGTTRMMLASNRSLPLSVFQVLAANGSDALLCILMGNPTFPSEARSLIAPSKRERYDRTVARIVAEIYSATNPSSINCVYSPGLDERMDLAAVMNPNLPAGAVSTLQAQGSTVVLNLLEKNVKSGFYRYFVA